MKTRMRRFDSCSDHGTSLLGRKGLWVWLSGGADDGQVMLSPRVDQVTWANR